jgi:glutathione synthase/RimK-type ligase-like ATP-grasp enzyme
LHQTKPVQLQLAREAIGLEAAVSFPNTVMLNSPKGVKDFANNNKHLIFKPVQGGAHTQPLEPHHLKPEALNRLEFSPVTLQEEIVGQDIRVFVIGNQTLACEIHTQHLDFRNDQDAVITPFELPEQVAECCQTICKALDLLWSGIDLKLTNTQKFYYLEANPSPMFIGFEKRSGLSLTDHLASLLTSETLF